MKRKRNIWWTFKEKKLLEIENKVIFSRPNNILQLSVLLLKLLALQLKIQLAQIGGSVINNFSVVITPKYAENISRKNDSCVIITTKNAWFHNDNIGPLIIINVNWLDLSELSYVYVCSMLNLFYYLYVCNAPILVLLPRKVIGCGESNIT